MSNLTQNILDGTPRDIVERYRSLAELAQQTDFGILDRNVVVIDTETTGLSFNHDELIQIAAARLETNEIADWYVTFINPEQDLSDEIIHLTGIKDSDLESAPSPQEALTRLVEFVGDAVLVAHNAAFDRTFLTRHPEGYPLLNNQWVDTLDLSRIAMPRLKSHRLIDLVRTFDAPQSTHRADDDVAATCVIYRILLAAVLSMPQQLVCAIANLASVQEWSTGFVFQQICELKSYSLKSGISVNIPQDSCAESFNSIQHNVQPNVRAKQLFSLYKLRQKRICDLPGRQTRKDADDLVGHLVFPTQEKIESEFTQDGALGRIYANFEPRDEQRAMSIAIRDAFATGKNLVVEAGTGVGKSMAYLIPAALMARANEITVGIATKTNSLLDQLVYKELPALAQALGDNGENHCAMNSRSSHNHNRDTGLIQNNDSPQFSAFSWAALKGMMHYPCLRKINWLVDEGAQICDIAGVPTSQAPALAALLSFIEQSEYDDIDALKIDYRVLPRRKFTTSSQECLRRKCPFFGKLCFVHGARRRAECADIVVTNHTLLFCDVALEGGLLPPIRHWIIDEAHSTEEEARHAFAVTLDSEELLRTASRITSSAGKRNVFVRVEQALINAQCDHLTLFYSLNNKAKQVGEEYYLVIHAYTQCIKSLLFFDSVQSQSRKRKRLSYEQADIWINEEVRNSRHFREITAIAKELVEKIDRLIKAIQDLVGYLEGIDEAAVVQRELATLVYDLRTARIAAELIFDIAPKEYAFHAIVYRKKDRFADKVSALLLDVGEKINETLYAHTHSIIFTSATMTVGNTFTSFEHTLGLNRSEFSQTCELQLDSSFDFDNNMIIYVVKDMPEPNELAYIQALNDLLIRTHLALHGSMLTLFTNRREMENAFSAVYPRLKEENLRLVCQKYGVSVKGLRDDFIANKNLSLFALKTFWEGFDAPGATLRGVIIPKLPFARPTDPLYCERASRDERSWWKYVLPKAVIETKQAAGRLIRKADDHGVLILADKRLVTKPYGKTFLNSLQSRTIHIVSCDEVVQSLELIGRLKPSQFSLKKRD